MAAAAADQSMSAVGGLAPGRSGRTLMIVVYLTVPAELDATIVNSPVSCFIVDGICITNWPSFSVRMRYRGE